MAHRHANLMAEYAKDAFKTSRPWERWECNSNVAGEWSACSSNPTWDPYKNYRRKPEKVKMWQWIYRDNNDGLTYLTNAFYASECEIQEQFGIDIARIIGKAAWTEIEVEP